jgi:hypothetical protein
MFLKMEREVIGEPNSTIFPINGYGESTTLELERQEQDLRRGGAVMIGEFEEGREEASQPRDSGGEKNDAAVMGDFFLEK